MELESASPLRDHVRLTTDVSEGFDRSLTVVQEEAVVEAVQTWLSEMLAGPNVGGDSR